MAVFLEGGCRVSDMREGAVVVNGTLSIWPQVGRAGGAQAISLRVLEFAPGTSPALRNEGCDEILYVLDRDFRNQASEAAKGGPSGIDSIANILIDGWPFPVTPQTGIYLRPGQTLTVDNPGPEALVLISSQCPEPTSAASEIRAGVIAPVSPAPPSSPGRPSSLANRQPTST